MLERSSVDDFDDYLLRRRAGASRRRAQLAGTTRALGRWSYEDDLRDALEVNRRALLAGRKLTQEFLRALYDELANLR